jgi:hypothetical protein
VRPARNFVRFRVKALGGRGGIERVAGQRASGALDTQKWLISKDKAHVENGMRFPTPRVRVSFSPRSGRRRGR